MKYVDEFRDGKKARVLIRQIEALVSDMTLPSDRPLYLMEVCGGHTHSIFRYGLEGMLPKAIELIHEKTLFPELAYMFNHALTHEAGPRKLAFVPGLST